MTTPHTDTREIMARAICCETPDRLGPITSDDGRWIEAGEPAWTAWVHDADLAISALAQAGLVIVPVEPTAKMIEAGDDVAGSLASTHDYSAQSTWSAMLAAHKDATCPSK